MPPGIYQISTGTLKKEFMKKRIPKAVFFDIDDICDNRSFLPHMLPSTSVFEKNI